VHDAIIILDADTQEKIVPFNVCKGQLKVLERQNLQTIQDIYKTFISLYKTFTKIKGTIFSL